MEPALDNPAHPTGTRPHLHSHQESMSIHAAGSSTAGKSSLSVVRLKAPPDTREAASSAWKRLSASAVAAVLSEAMTMPVDFAKVRLQLQVAHSSAAGGAAAAVHYSGMTDCIARTVRAEGASALYRGIGPALARQVGYTGSCYVLYEPILNKISQGACAVVCSVVALFAALGAPVAVRYSLPRGGLIRFEF